MFENFTYILIYSARMICFLCYGYMVLTIKLKKKDILLNVLQPTLCLSLLGQVELFIFYLILHGFSG